jgi:hypothetical protein
MAHSTRSLQLILATTLFLAVAPFSFGEKILFEDGKGACDLSKIFKLSYRDGGLHMEADADQDWNALYRDLMKAGRFRSIQIKSRSGGWSASMGGSRAGALVIDLNDEKQPRLEARFEGEERSVVLILSGQNVRITIESPDGAAFRMLRVWKGGASLYSSDGDRHTDEHASTLGELVLREPSIESELLVHLGELGLSLGISRDDPQVVRYVTGPVAVIEGHAATRVTALLDSLGSDDFAAREQAQAALDKLAADPAFVRHLVALEPGIEGLEVRGRVGKILERTGEVAARFRLIRDEKLETDRAYLEKLAGSKVESVREGAKRRLAGLDSDE